MLGTFLVFERKKRSRKQFCKEESKDSQFGFIMAERLREY